MNLWHRIDLARQGLAADLALYCVLGLFAWSTSGSTLAAHRAWAAIAVWGYLAAAGTVLLQLLVRRYAGTAWRAGLTAATWLSAAVLPLVVLATDRAAGMAGRAQEEVQVVEESAVRLLHSGTPYLGREAIARLPEPLLGYDPYQPGMSVFGTARAAFGIAWWTDARIWFALFTATMLAIAAALTRDGTRTRDALLVRAAQAVSVLPLAALTLATGGDDLPVLALCLLALALAARGRFGWSGLAAGVAAALKLFAWPVLLVLAVHAMTSGRFGRFTVPALGLPLGVLVPAALVDTPALVENLVAFPTGNGLVASPAASPLPGYLIAQHSPGGRTVAMVLLAAAATAIAVWLARRPPRDAGAAAQVCAIGLLAAILLMPATRFGYLLYPVAFAVWVPLLRSTMPTPSATQPASTTGQGVLG